MAVNVTGGDSLKFVAELELEEFKKSEKELEKTIMASAEAGVRASKKRNKAVEEEISTIQKRKVIFSDSQKEVDEYQKSLGKVGARVATSGKDEFIRLLNKDLKEGKITAAELKAELDRIAALKLNTSKTSTTPQKGGLLENLTTKKADLVEGRNLETSLEKLEMYNAKIQTIDKEIKKLTNVGKQGFDDMGKKIVETLEKPIGQLNRLKYAAAEYGKMAAGSTNPAIIEKYNKKLQDTQAEIKRVGNVGKAGFDNMGNAINTNTANANGFLGSLRNIASALGLAFGIAQVVAFGKELFNVAISASGIDRAFSRLGNSQDLQRLREETQGFVSDLQLEKLTTKANNFNIPISKLGGFLLFAQQRAKDTGESVDKLTENIIDGLGRKSSRIIDNLGISIVDIQKEFSKTGDFTVAVSNLIQRESETAGVAVETLADRTGRLAIKWENALKAVSGFFAKLMNSDIADSGMIGELTKQQSKAIGLIRKNESETTAFQKKEAGERSKIIQNQLKEVLKLSAAKEKSDKQYDGMFADRSKRAIDDERRATGERLAAAQNVLRTLKDQNIEREKIERTAKNILSIAEMEEKVASLRTKADNIIIGVSGTESERAKLYKEAQKTQEFIENLKGKNQKKNLKAEESEAKKQARLDAQALKAKDALSQKIFDIEAEYSRKSLSKDEEELQAVRDKFKSIAKEVEDFNANPKNKFKVDASSLDNVRDKAISDLKYQQETELLKISLDDQKKLYEDFEDYKLNFGLEKAKEKFGKELNYRQSLENDIAITQAQVMAGGGAKAIERLNELSKLYKLEVDAEEKKNLDLLKSLLTYEQERKLIIERYQRERAKLEGNAAAISVLDGKFKEELNSLDDANVKKLDSYKALFEDIEKMSARQAQKVIDDARAMLTALLSIGAISKDLAKDITDKLNEGQKAVNSKIPNKLFEAANILNDIAGTVSEINEEFGNLLRNVAGAVASYASISKSAKTLNDANASAADKQSAGLSLAIEGAKGLITVISTITSAAKRRKEAEEAYYRSIIEGQREYNLSLNDTIRLRSELDDNVFLTDSKGKILAGTEALTDANKKYLESLKALSGGQAKTGQRNAVDWNSVGAAAGGGVAVGAAIGSVVPVIGTAIGSVVGGIVGAIAGLFGGKKKKDVFGGLLQEYPELILKAKDGTIGINKELAESLVSQNLVNDSTKDLIKNTLDWAEKVEAAREQIKGVISDLAGGLGNNIRNSLVAAFKEGTDAAKAFGDEVNKVVEDIVAQFLFNELFSKNFDTLQKDMAESFGLAGDQSVVDDLSKFYKEAGTKVDLYNKSLEAASFVGAENGLDIFKKKDNSNSSNSMAGNIERSITEETGGLIIGQFNGLRLVAIQGNVLLTEQLKINRLCFDIAMQNLNTAIKIEANTFRTANNTDRLAKIESTLISMDGKMNNGYNDLTAAGRI